MKKPNHRSVTAKKQSPAVKPTAKPTVQAPKPPLEASVFGALPKGVRLWGLARQTASGELERLARPSQSGEYDEEYFRLAELSLRYIRSMWGGGRYRIMWFGPGKTGQRHPLGGTRWINIRPPEQKEPAAQPSALPPELDGLAKFRELRAVLREESQREVDAVAKSFGMLMEVQAAAFKSQMEALTTRPVAAPAADESSFGRIEKMLASVLERDDDDDEPSTTSIVPFLSDRLQNGIANVLDQLAPNLPALITAITQKVGVRP